MKKNLISCRMKSKMHLRKHYPALYKHYKNGGCTLEEALEAMHYTKEVVKMLKEED